MQETSNVNLTEIYESAMAQDTDYRLWIRQQYDDEDQETYYGADGNLRIRIQFDTVDMDLTLI